ncbi:MAG: hypothetical protein QXK12_07155 [Candidatus Nezhaarchaeales archaeon]
MVSLKLAVALCLLVGFSGLSLSYAFQQQKIDALKLEVANLQNQYSNLQLSYTDAQNRYLTLRRSYEDLEANLSKLKLEHKDLQSRYNTLLTRHRNLEDSYKAEVLSLNNLIEGLKSNLTRIEERNSELRANLTQLQAEYKKLQAKYEGLLERLRKPGLRDPTWQELKSFLEEDDVNRLIYKPHEFDCSGFAITFRDRAWKRGFRCAYVEISYGNGSGHALNAFQTVDEGLIYVDVTGNKEGTGVDKIAYVEVGKPYGLICLEGVKHQYIACEGDPAAFWGPLTYATHPNPFSYDYYVNYQRRRQFYDESVKAYNKAVEEYNKGSTKYTREQLTKWRENLEALKKDLGPYYGSLGVVQTVELYWPSDS